MGFNNRFFWTFIENMVIYNRVYVEAMLLRTVAKLTQSH